MKNTRAVIRKYFTIKNKYYIVNLLLVSFFYGLLAQESAVRTNGFFEPLPEVVDNSTNPYVRPVFKQNTGTCGHASSIGNILTYEINAARESDAKDSKNQCAFLYTYHFINNGTTKASDDFRSAWTLAMENGVPSVADWGGLTAGYHTQWLNGYDKYHRAMSNTISETFEIDMKSSTGLEKMKQWLYNHNGEAKNGGVLLFNVNVASGIKRVKIPNGSPEAGKTLVIKWGSGGSHCMTIIGYNDNIKYDLNNDGKYTNDIDITNDQIVDIRDREVGAIKYLNTHGIQKDDKGYGYMLYSLLSKSESQGGIRQNNKIFGIRLKKDYSPKLTLKITLTHDSRNQINIVPGVSSDIKATKPDKKKVYKKLFKNAGGKFPMEGKSKSSTIEIGLDVTDFLSEISNNQAKFFLEVASKGGVGKVNDFSLIDYRENKEGKEFKCPEKDVVIKNGTTTTLAIVFASTGNKSTSSIQYTNNQKMIVSYYPMSGPTQNVLLSFPARTTQSSEVSIFNGLGQIVFYRNYFNAMDEGEYTSNLTIPWDCTNSLGKKVASGNYYATVSLVDANGQKIQLHSMLNLK